MYGNMQWYVQVYVKVIVWKFARYDIPRSNLISDSVARVEYQLNTCNKAQNVISSTMVERWSFIKLFITVVLHCLSS